MNFAFWHWLCLCLIIYSVNECTFVYHRLLFFSVNECIFVYHRFAQKKKKDLVLIFTWMVELMFSLTNTILDKPLWSTDPQHQATKCFLCQSPTHHLCSRHIIWLRTWHNSFFFLFCFERFYSCTILFVIPHNALWFYRWVSRILCAFMVL